MFGSEVPRLLLLTLGHVEVLKGAAKLGRDLVEHLGGNFQVEMGVTQLPGRVLKWPTRQRGDPQRPQKLEAR